MPLAQRSLATSASAWLQLTSARCLDNRSARACRGTSCTRTSTPTSRTAPSCGGAGARAPRRGSAPPAGGEEEEVHTPFPPLTTCFSLLRLQAANPAYNSTHATTLPLLALPASERVREHGPA